MGEDDDFDVGFVEFELQDGFDDFEDLVGVVAAHVDVLLGGEDLTARYEVEAGREAGLRGGFIFCVLS